LVSNPNIGTFDLEAFKDSDGFAKPYAVGFCVLNQKPVTFYLDKGNQDILLNCIDSMLITKHHNYIFYIHNLNYDGIYIINKLKSVNLIKGFEYYRIKTLYKDSAILKLEISIGKNSDVEVKDQKRYIKIIFKDSSNMLKGKLQSLCKSYNIDVGKGYFPYNFVNANNLHYIGVTPPIIYWTDIPNDEYNKLIKSDWNLKEECLLYLEKDLTSLLEIVNLFNKYINRKFDIQMTDSLTISRLSLNIFFLH
jgi:hypothetical protein